MMKIGNTYHVYNKEIQAESIVKVINIVNNNYICMSIHDDFPLVFTKEVLKVCELTLLEECTYPTVVDSSKYVVNIS